MSVATGMTEDHSTMTPTQPSKALRRILKNDFDTPVPKFKSKKGEVYRFKEYLGKQETVILENVKNRRNLFVGSDDGIFSLFVCVCVFLRFIAKNWQITSKKSLKWIENFSVQRK